MGRADLLWPRVDLDLTRKVRLNTGRVNLDQWWARLEAGRGGDSFDPLWPGSTLDPEIRGKVVN